MNSKIDPWHFSHLGKEYFFGIANNIGYVDIWFTQIEDLYIGSTGVPYREKKFGRQVNPNWCVRMKTDRSTDLE